MKPITGGQVQERFTQSSPSVLSVGIIGPLDDRVHRENLGDLSVVSVRCLCDLGAKFFAFLQPSRNFMNNPG